MRSMALLCALLPLARGAIVALTTNYVTFLEVDAVDPHSGVFTKIVELDPNYPGPTVFPDANTALLGVMLPNSLDACLVTVDLQTGKIQEGERIPDFLINGLAFDKKTSRTFAMAFNNTREPPRTNQLFEILADQTLEEINDLPPGLAMTVTYSSSEQILFYVPRDSRNSLLSVDQQGNILYDVPLAVEIRSMVFDDTSGVLYVWGVDPAETSHLMFMSVDHTTGQSIKTFYETRSLTAGPSTCIDESGAVVYTSMWDKEKRQDVFLTLDLGTGSTTQAFTDRYAIALNC